MSKMYDDSTPLALLTVGQFLEILKSFQITESKKAEHPRFLTPQLLSDLTGLAMSTIYIKNSHKEIPGAKKIGGSLLFDTAEILEWIESGSVHVKPKR